MIVGIDFDNTIIKYDNLFYKLCLEKKLIPKYLANQKNIIRDFLRDKNKENEWTIIQGEVYGERIEEASAYPGMIDAITKLKSMDIPVKIISHKTKYPYKGPKRNLHEAALKWMTKNNFFDGKLNFEEKDIFFESTKEQKVERISSLGCTHYIDDLPEILEMIPSSIIRINFSPSQKISNHNFKLMTKWSQLLQII